MDKPQKIKENLSKIMFTSLSEINFLVNHFLEKAQTYTKADGSPVTDLDLALSDKLEKIALENDFNFYSEEKIGPWKFPLLIVDPIDGTKEFIAGRDEWVVSVASLLNDKLEGEGWIYNPLQKKIYSDVSSRPFVDKPIFYGEASRSEWAQGLYQESFSNFKMKPMGSIAFKLARLAAGEIDFVVSLRPKNVWDIAAGTILCQKAGIHFYSQNREVKKFVPYFQGPLIWCHPELYQRLSKHFYSQDKGL